MVMIEGVAYSVHRVASRRWRRPRTWSNSPSVRITPRTGVERIPALGCSSGHRASCWVMSGVALMRYHPDPSGENAREQCAIGAMRCWRAASQFAHRQFHWGTPPPAAVPRRRRRMDDRTETRRAGLSVAKPALLPQPGYLLYTYAVTSAQRHNSSNEGFVHMPVHLLPTWTLPSTPRFLPPAR